MIAPKRTKQDAINSIIMVLRLRAFRLAAIPKYIIVLTNINFIIYELETFFSHIFKKLWIVRVEVQKAVMLPALVSALVSRVNLAFYDGCFS